MDPTLILQCRAPGLFIAKMIFLEMFSALRKSGLLRHVTSRHVTSRHVTFCDSQFIQQQEDTQWVLRNTMGEIIRLSGPSLFNTAHYGSETSNETLSQSFRETLR